jgi:hypothetical protein
MVLLNFRSLIKRDRKLQQNMTENPSLSATLRSRRVHLAALPAQGDSARLGAVADGGVEPEELEDALAVRAAAASSLVAAHGQVPHLLHQALPQRACSSAAVAVAARGRFGKGAIEGGHGVAELPIDGLRRPLPLPSLLSLSTHAYTSGKNVCEGLNWLVVRVCIHRCLHLWDGDREKSVSMCKFRNVFRQAVTIFVAECRKTACLVPTPSKVQVNLSSNGMVRASYVN